MATSGGRRVGVPGDKSITHRALMLAALGQGESRVRGALQAEDTGSTRRVLQDLGVRIESAAPAELIIQGRGLRGLAQPHHTLDCGNSGTSARLLLGILAAQPLTAALSGDASLRSRPMRRVTAPLRSMGASIRELGAPDRLPVEVVGGALTGIDFVSPTASAQVKSALLLAGLTGGVPVTVTEPLTSRDHTERMLRGLGVGVAEGVTGGEHRVALEPVSELPALDVVVPGDFSAAAFLIAAGLLLQRELLIENVGVNPTRTGLLPALARMGSTPEVIGARLSGGEPVADLLVRPAGLRGTTVSPAEIPALIDEVPALAVLAATAAGETLITGAGELRVKESDRIAMLVANLRAIGAAAEELPDGLVIQGRPGPFRGPVDPAGDHRIAMAFGVLGAVPGNDIRISGRESAAVSFPGFWDQLRELESGR